MNIKSALVQVVTWSKDDPISECFGVFPGDHELKEHAYIPLYFVSIKLKDISLKLDNDNELDNEVQCFKIKVRCLLLCNI